jgi:hypothetical protein
MSIFGYFYIVYLLKEMDWPRKRGFFRQLAYDTTVVDMAIDQMIQWAAALGAGRPLLALQMIAEMNRNQDWDSEDAPQIIKAINIARKQWDQKLNASPQEIIAPIRFEKKYGKYIHPNVLGDKFILKMTEGYVLLGLLWGLVNKARFIRWYSEEHKRFETRKELYNQMKLNVESPPIIGEYYQQCGEIVRAYEQKFNMLPKIPNKLLSDAKILGIEVNKQRVT